MTSTIQANSEVPEQPKRVPGCTQWTDGRHRISPTCVDDDDGRTSNGQKRNDKIGGGFDEETLLPRGGRRVQSLLYIPTS